MKRTTRPAPHKDRSTTADFIPYDEAMTRGRELLFTERPQFGFLIILGVNTGLRIGDLLKFTHEELQGRMKGDHLSIIEQKTRGRKQSKHRRVTLNDAIISSYNALRAELQRRGKPVTGTIFMSQKNTVYSNAHVNLLLKQTFPYVGNVSSHSLRKAFGRRVYENNGKTEHALVELSDIFNHSSIGLTRRYLGLRDERIADIYLNL
ncbi:MAG: tyrosine-type recombinase/integrase [Bacteroidales bacterium]